MSEISYDWIETFSGAVTICDPHGIILYMNRKASENFRDYGGVKLLGTNLLECHPEPSRTKLKNMLEKETFNVYTIEKNGIKKIIYQTPLYRNGVYAGFVELSLEIPGEMPHFIRT